MTAVEKIAKKLLCLLLAMLLFKAATDYGYVKMVAWDTEKYTLDFNFTKYALSTLTLILLFLAIRHDRPRASSFLLLFFFLFQMVPLTTIYALGNDNSEFYYSVCLGFLLCEGIVAAPLSVRLLERKWSLALMMTFFLALLTLGLLVYVYRSNGLPSTQALDIYAVYDLRASGRFQIHKYAGYVMSWVAGAILPFFLAKFLDEKRFVLALIPMAMIGLLYLYTGNKTYLFSLPLISICTIGAKQRDGYFKLFLLGCLGWCVLVWAALYAPVLRSLFFQAYQLIGRRVMLVSANNKFKYFDFFSRRPKLGITGIFPTWIVPPRGVYKDVPYSYLISAIYYKAPEMNSNTGFLAEGYMRFDHFGTLFLFLLLAFLLKEIDRLQERTSYAFAVGLFIYPIFGLADGQLLSSMVAGEWLILLLLLLFYRGPSAARRTFRRAALRLG